MSSDLQMVSKKSPPEPMERERRELETVAAALGNSSRLQRLILYIGESYFRGETDKLHEYAIATEVFGRSKATFNAGEDAIVRVEAHRLRRRLKEYYEGEGKDHPLQLSIPPGSYVPVFTSSAGPAKLEGETFPAPSNKWSKARWWMYAAAAVALAVAVFGIYRVRWVHFGKKDASGVPASSLPGAASLNAASYPEIPLRILAGYVGKPQIDSAGDVWQPDRYFHLGGTWNRPETLIARTSNPLLFEHWRNGEFSYDIPLRPGVYELHLYFVAAEPDASEPATFSFSVNGKNILSGFDVDADALGPNIADERIFRDISPASDGILHLGFTSERGTSALNALEILAGAPNRQLPVRLVMQPRSFTDHNGQFWRPDDYYANGYTSTKRAQITETPDPDLFAAERYGHFTYTIPVDTRDRYTLILHFAEFYFGPAASGVGGVGSRVFRIMCNGNTLLDNFDIYKEVGSLHLVTKTFYHLKPTSQGKLNVTFEPIVNNATVSGIEVIDEAQ